MEAQVKQLQAVAGTAVDKQPSSSGPNYNDYHTMTELCRVLGLTPDDLAYMKTMCKLGRRHGHNWITDCISLVQQCDTACTAIKRQCLTLGNLIQKACCPGQQLYSQITIDEYSDNNQVRLGTIIQNFGPGFVNAYPVPPGSAVRLEHASRPGYIPTKIAVDLALANNGTNYLDIEIQFYLGDGGSVKGKAIGDPYTGNQFLNKDGTQIHLPFPPYRGKPVDVGSIEKLAVEVRHIGGINNIESVMVIVYHDAKCFYDLCRAPDEICVPEKTAC